MQNQPSENDTSEETFTELSQQSDPGLVAEFIEFLVHNKKWWLTPIVVTTLLLTLLVFLAGSPVAPFIYTLF